MAGGRRDDSARTRRKILIFTQGPALGGVEVAAAAALLEVDHSARRVDQVAEERSPLDQRLAFRGKVDPVEVLRVELLQARLEDFAALPGYY